MEYLIWGGAIISMIGIVMLAYCIRAAFKARRDISDDDQLKAEVQRLAAINMGALAISTIGLMAVILGIFLS